MNTKMKNYTKKIQKAIRNDGNWEKEFLKYKKYLEKNLEKNPKDVESVCQLATCYLEIPSCDNKEAISLLENFLKLYYKEITVEERNRIFIDLSFCCQGGNWKKWEHYLKKMLKLNINSINVYIALGTYYYEQIFHRTLEKDCKRKTLYFFKKAYFFDKTEKKL